MGIVSLRTDSEILGVGENQQAMFCVSVTQVSAQPFDISCEQASITLPQAYVPVANLPSSIVIDASTDLSRQAITNFEFPPVDQYEAEVSNFSKVIRGIEAPYYDLSDARANAAVSDAIVESAQSGGWAAVNPL